MRAQALISRGSPQRPSIRAEAAYADASPNAWPVARRESAETQSRAHELQVETLRLTQLAEQTRARSEQIAGPTWPKWTPNSDELQERKRHRRSAL